MAVGRWQLASDSWNVAVGRWQLAQVWRQPVRHSPLAQHEVVRERSFTSFYLWKKTWPERCLLNYLWVVYCRSVADASWAEAKLFGSVVCGCLSAVCLLAADFGSE